MRSRALISAAFCAAAICGTAVLAPAAAAAAPVGPGAPSAAAAAADTADFNADGYPDLAIGAHSATAGGVKRAGVVTVAYGSADGLTYESASIVGKNTAGVPGEPVEDDKWREVRGFGDLDGDGYDDLVLHWMEKNMVLWGSADGITGTGTTLPVGHYTKSDPKLLGGGIGVGDVNGDKAADFVSRSNHGEYGLSVLLGPIDRSTGKPAGVWNRDHDDMDGVLTSTVFVGDMTGDGLADVVASGGRVLGNGAPAGRILKGSKNGLVKGPEFEAPYQYNHDQYLTPSAFGDLNKDGYQDLVTGYSDQNRIHVAYGGPGGSSETLKSRTYGQASAGVPGVEEAGDRFGASVSIGDTDGDGYADVVVGASYETGSDPAVSTGSGAITVLRGGPEGITAEGAKSFTQNSAGIPSTSETNDHFGASVELVDADKDGRTELYVGGNGEDGFKGRVWKLAAGGADGVVGAGASSFHLGTLGGDTGGGNFGHRMAG
jgi:hypothetical protein